MPLPSVSPLAEAALNLATLGSAGRQLVDLLRGGRLAVITGAGISTQSGIKDYRSPGRPPYKPLQHHEFVTSEAVRRRYWARSTLGWATMGRAAPNAAHRALAALEAAGRVDHVITQNVDRLHQAAGSRAVLELHGTIHEVACLACGAGEPRVALQQRLLADNAAFLARWAPHADERPDGDVELPPEAYADFCTPGCLACGKPLLKPCVVFHGGNVPEATKTASAAIVEAADGVLCVGTSLTVWSSYRLARDAAKAGKPVGLLNYGPTRADDLATFKIEAHVSSVLAAAAGEVLGETWTALATQAAASRRVAATAAAAQ